MVYLLKASARFLKCTPDVLLKSKRGKGGGTWAVEQIALEYAQYLSPELAVLDSAELRCHVNQ
ncbi:KilA-N domain-containing protein [Spirosoma luteum]|uniref:KilA-N domain-containing protein n=1 Tax=Spirosoma luteum TaxID=431553 RepID=UPI000A0691A7